MIWFLIEYLYEGEIWPFDVKASSENEAIDLFKQTEVYQSGECSIKSVSIMSASEARIAQKNHDRIMNHKSYEERLKELEAEDEEFKKTALYRRLLQLYRERMKTKNNEEVS